MAINAAAAIISWREHLEQHGGGLASYEQSFTVSTMLFGCHQWLDRHAVDAPPALAQRIAEIKHELEDWLGQRGLTYNGGLAVSKTAGRNPPARCMILPVFCLAPRFLPLAASNRFPKAAAFGRQNERDEQETLLDVYMKEIHRALGEEAELPKLDRASRIARRAQRVT